MKTRLNLCRIQLGDALLVEVGRAVFLARLELLESPMQILVDSATQVIAEVGPTAGAFEHDSS
jgi:hypothetical protein